MSKNKTKLGMCKLTLKEGQYVKAHIIPQAFTCPEEKGLPLEQLSSGNRPTRRWTSWYDPCLVIREGEDVFSDLDNWAIRVLREKKLVWSGWESEELLAELSNEEQSSLFPVCGKGMRVLNNIDQSKLRLFLLSLLWRSAMTDLKEFSEIDIPESDLEKIRLILLGKETDSHEFYPISLIQLSTKGIIHNHTPIRQSKETPKILESEKTSIVIYRFYFDGLIIHFHIRNESNSEYFNNNLIVGFGEVLLITTITYEDSFQKENLEFIIKESL